MILFYILFGLVVLLYLGLLFLGLIIMAINIRKSAKRDSEYFDLAWKLHEEGKLPGFAVEYLKTNATTPSSPPCQFDPMPLLQLYETRRTNDILSRK
jgi:hypothetical protein